MTEAALEQALFSIVRCERLARDRADWETMHACYWSDATVRVTWFTGTAEDFIDKSATRKADNGSHVIAPTRVQVVGDRAFVESPGQTLLRPSLDGVAVDVTAWCRFIGLLERRSGEWRLACFDSIYVKDRVDVVVPGESLHLDAEKLAQGRESYRYLTYLNRQGGFTVPDDLPGVDKPELVDAYYDSIDRWLH